MDEHSKNTLGELLIAVSVLATAFAAWGYFVGNLWLAPTQWLLIATTTAIYATYLRLPDSHKRK